MYSSVYTISFLQLKLHRITSFIRDRIKSTPDCQYPYLKLKQLCRPISCREGFEADPNAQEKHCLNPWLDFELPLFDLNLLRPQNDQIQDEQT